MPIINVWIVRSNKPGVDHWHNDGLGNLISGLKKLEVRSNVMKVYKNLAIVTGIHHASSN
jgi:hypothetical protein